MAKGLVIRTMELEYVRCNLCGADDTRLVLEELGFPIVQCKSCGLMYVNPRLTEKALYRIYNLSKQDVAESTLPPELVTCRQRSELYYSSDELGGLNQAISRQMIRYWLRKIREYRPAGRMLDIGCGLGGVLRVANAEFGYEPYGIDLSERWVQYCHHRGLKNVQEGRFEDIVYEDQSFDVVIMTNILEHVRDPRSTLRKVHGILKPGGIVFIQVPNANYLVLKARLLNAFGLKEKMSATLPMGILVPHEHLYNYSSRTLAAFLSQTGFFVLELSFLMHILKRVDKGMVSTSLCVYDRLARLLYATTRGAVNMNRSLLAWARKLELACDNLLEKQK